MKSLSRPIAAVGALLLAGCIVSDSALFNAENAAATPIAGGAYDACSGSNDGEPSECNPMSVDLSEDGLYTLLVEDDRIEMRMIAIDEDDFAVQLSEDEDGFHYYWGRMSDNALTLAMLWCQDLPKTLVDKLIEDGAIDADEDRQTCNARTVGAVVIAAKAYAAGENAGDLSWVTLTPVSGAQ